MAKHASAASGGIALKVRTQLSAAEAHRKKSAHLHHGVGIIKNNGKLARRVVMA